MEEISGGFPVCSLATGWIIDANGVKYPALRFCVEGQPTDEDLVVPLNVGAIVELQDALQSILDQALEEDARGQ